MKLFERLDKMWWKLNPSPREVMLLLAIAGFVILTLLFGIWVMHP